LFCKVIFVATYSERHSEILKWLNEYVRYYMLNLFAHATHEVGRTFQIKLEVTKRAFYYKGAAIFNSLQLPGHETVFMV